MYETLEKVHIFFHLSALFCPVPDDRLILYTSRSADPNSDQERIVRKYEAEESATWPKAQVTLVERCIYGQLKYNGLVGGFDLTKMVGCGYPRVHDVVSAQMVKCVGRYNWRATEVTHTQMTALNRRFDNALQAMSATDPNRARMEQWVRDKHDICITTIFK
jgi:hypothetical protein